VLAEHTLLVRSLESKPLSVLQHFYLKIDLFNCCVYKMYMDMHNDTGCVKKDGMRPEIENLEVDALKLEGSSRINWYRPTPCHPGHQIRHI
jgi:hypothetical protein